MAAPPPPDAAAVRPGRRIRPERCPRLSMPGMAWRQPALAALTLLGCVSLFLLIRSLTALPVIDAQWSLDALGQVVLVGSRDPALQQLTDTRLRTLQAADGPLLQADGLLLQHSTRWVVEDADRTRLLQLNTAWEDGVRQRTLQLGFADGTVVRPAPAPRGLAGLGLIFWFLGLLALLLYLTGCVAALVRPQVPVLLFALMAGCQAASLLLVAVASLPGPGVPGLLLRWDLPARMALDLATATAAVHLSLLHPYRRPWANRLAGLAWVAGACLMMPMLAGTLPGAWWWIQGALLLYGVLAIVVLAFLLRSFASLAAGSLGLLTAAIALAARPPGLSADIAWLGALLGTLLLGGLLPLAPLLARTQQLIREFALLAGVSTLAISLDLAFIAAFPAADRPALAALSLSAALGLYAGLRQWMVNQLAGVHALTPERLLEQLYRVTREVHRRPEQLSEQLQQLLRLLFEPLEVRLGAQPLSGACAADSGATLLVPLPEHGGGTQTVALRFAHQGRLMFTPQDARLAERVIEQVQHALDHHRAVEQGRREERLRLAQDLHDDIGARLLTLMYQAPSPEIENYVRRTLQDLKTITRGMAADSHRLSHAVPEWKSDIAQRLAAAGCELGWRFTVDADIELGVVQWSALTRVLRELVSNAITHAGATRVDVLARYEAGRLTLQVCDNGCGRDPQRWSHGLGLVGVRKRIKQLGGEVHWAARAPAGIECRVVVPRLCDGG